MKDIKIRAWYKQESQMISWSDLSASAWNSFRGDRPISLLHDVLVGRKSEFVSMPFIGLLDMNGKDIYLNDIIMSPTSEVAKIIYRVCAHVLEFENGVTRSIPFNLLHWEVIGNVFENPEKFKQV